METEEKRAREHLHLLEQLREVHSAYSSDLENFIKNQDHPGEHPKKCAKRNSALSKRKRNISTCLEKYIGEKFGLKQIGFGVKSKSVFLICHHQLWGFNYFYCTNLSNYICLIGLSGGTHKNVDPLRHTAADSLENQQKSLISRGSVIYVCHRRGCIPNIFFCGKLSKMNSLIDLCTGTHKNIDPVAHTHPKFCPGIGQNHQTERSHVSYFWTSPHVSLYR